MFGSMESFWITSPCPKRKPIVMFCCFIRLQISRKIAKRLTFPTSSSHLFMDSHCIPQKPIERLTIQFHKYIDRSW